MTDQPGSGSDFSEVLARIAENARRIEVPLLDCIQSSKKSQFRDANMLLQQLIMDADTAKQEARNAEHRLEQLQELVRTSALITSSLDVHHVLEEVIDTIITLTGTTRGYLMLYEGPENKVQIQIARNWNHETLPEETIGFSRSVIQKVVESREPLLTTNAQADVNFQTAESIIRYGLYAILCVPLVYRGNLIGVIYVDSCSNFKNFKPDIVSSLTAFANQAVIAIENARLFEHVKADLDKAQREVQRLRIQEVASISNDVLPALVETVAQILKLPYAAMTLKQDDQFVVAAEFGVPEGELLRFALIYQAELVGELLLSKPFERSFSPDDLYLIDELIRQAAIAVHAVRLTLDLQRSRERLVTAREEERRRLRRDLHDGLGPVLASLTLGLDTARNLLKQDAPAADQLIADLKGQVQSAIADIRRVVYELRPPALDELGLVSAIREQILQYHRQTPLRISFVAPDDLPTLSAAVEVAVYRIIVEGLFNVVRHAHAQTCHIHLIVSDMLYVEISDDGVGMPEAWHPGVGITSMRERATELGGNCFVEPRLAGGTRLLAHLPLVQK